MNIRRLTGGEEEPRKIEGYRIWQDSEMSKIYHRKRGMEHLDANGHLPPITDEEGSK